MRALRPPRPRPQNRRHQTRRGLARPPSCLTSSVCAWGVSACRAFGSTHTHTHETTKTSPRPHRKSAMACCMASSLIALGPCRPSCQASSRARGPTAAERRRHAATGMGTARGCVWASGRWPAGAVGVGRQRPPVHPSFHHTPLRRRRCGHVGCPPAGTLGAIARTSICRSIQRLNLTHLSNTFHTFRRARRLHLRPVEPQPPAAPLLSEQ